MILTLRRHLRAAPARGFTIMEILLAVAILSTMVVLVLGAMSSSFRMRNRTVDMFDTQRSARQALERMTRELNMAFHVHEASERVAQTREIRYRTAFEGRRDEITFATMGHIQRYADEISSGQAEISYRLERQRGRDGQVRQNLVRREQSPIDDRPDRGGTLSTVLRDVRSIRFEYWDPDRQIGGEAWINQWDASREEGRLPDRVRVTIELEHPYLQRQTLRYSAQADIRLTDPLVLLPADIAAAVEEQRQQQRDVQDTAREQLMNPGGGRLGTGGTP